MENGVVHYGGEFYSDDDLKSWALVSLFEALMFPFPPHHQANIEVHWPNCLPRLPSGNHLLAKYLKLNHVKLWGFGTAYLIKYS
ncbi:hypothetical protein CMV_009945 [Castanea mollissima]|uniref:Uncharacterized protein n=1 Tax=Castanea mollissima TaxID=60419 RepID=A0A8J4RGE9_9ROSI|nr:hypothetical protein CMV_009945 [Castanea mollissima]